MEWGLLLKGWLLGLSIAAPVGPIGVLCIQRTLTRGRLVGLVSGLGAATADAFYGSLAAFGLTAISGALVSGQTALRLVGGAFLCFLGWRTLRSRPATSGADAPVRGGLPGAYASTLALTLTNPLTILSFAAIFAGLGVAAGSADFGGAAALVAGVFLGSACWWLVLSTAVGLFRGRLGPARLIWVNRGSGLLILGFGLLALASLLA